MKPSEKKTFYENATRELLSQLNTMTLSPADKNKAVYYTKLFREAFKYDAIKKHVFLSQENIYWNFGYDSAGFCYASSVVFSIMTGFQNWNLMYIDADKWPGYVSHYYLKHLKSGKFFDITFDQFSVDGFTVPYEIGEIAPFALTPGDTPFKFADVLNLDLIKTLRNSTTRK